MSGSYTTAMCGSAKAEAFSAGHCFAATVTPTCNLTNGSTAIASLSSAAGLWHGMPVSGTGIPANTFLLNNGGTWLLSQAATATNNGVTLTCTGDTFKIALGIPSPNGTYGASSTNYSNLTGNSDELANGNGYTTGGQALTANISPANSGANCYFQFSNNPSWTGLTASVRAAMIYNTSYRANGNNRAISVHDFGGTVSVSAGTLTLLQPTNAASTSLFQVN